MNNETVRNLLGVSDEREAILKEVIIDHLMVKKSFVSSDLLSITRACQTENEKIWASHIYGCMITQLSANELIRVKDDIKRALYVKPLDLRTLIRMMVTLIVYAITCIGIRYFATEDMDVLILMLPLSYFLYNSLWLNYLADYAKKRQKAAEDLAIQILNQNQNQ